MFVKICGITDVDDGLLAVALGADSIGLNFVSGSVRQIAPARAREIAGRIPRETLTVGIFRNEAKERVVDLVSTCGLGAAQLHGNESPEEVLWIADRVPTVIKAVSAGTAQAQHAGDFPVSIILVDAAVPGAGETFDWALAKSLPKDKQILLAGGLNPDNVAAAIAAVRPWGVDVASGVEQAPGRKDPSALRRFIQNAKTASEAVYDHPTDSDMDNS